MFKKLSNLVVLFVVVTMAGCMSFTEPRYDSGRDSFMAGNYYQAFKQLYPAAQSGNADAQYAVGYMYYYGLGTGQDRQAAISWMQKAANQGQSQANHAVQSILNTGYTTTTGYTGNLSRPSMLRGSSNSSRYVPASNSSQSTSANSSDSSASVPNESSSKRRASWPLSRQNSGSSDTSSSSNTGSQSSNTKSDVTPESTTQVASAADTKPEVAEAAVPATPVKTAAKTTDSYAIQILASYDITDLERFADTQNMGDKTRAQITERNGKKWYILLYGDYPNFYAANKEIAKLPQSVQANHPWVRHNT